MNRMMAGMDVKPTGDVDADFAAMMILELPHVEKGSARLRSEVAVVEAQWLNHPIWVEPNLIRYIK
jgi:hypothetical protein